MEVINIADIKNPETGKTYRDENLEKMHNIPLGAMVEVVNADIPTIGLRLFVVELQRDCDGTPLYGLSFDKEWHPDMYGKTYNIVARARVDGGYSEECLKIIE